jgi:hypothetical protein
MVFDTSTAFLRQVRWGEREVVRAIFGAVRDRNWDTILHRIDDLQVSEQEGAFELSFTARSLAASFPFHWGGRIIGSTEGELTYRFVGKAGGTVWKNRIGLCVLHPTRECVGNACVIEHTDGTKLPGEFPTAISPHQPFKDMRAIQHPIVAGSTASVTITFAGDTFEMEDQRNWSDASFKTYSTPLELPFPVKLDSEATIEQTVHVQVTGVEGGRGAVGDSSDVVDVEVEWENAVARCPVGLLLPEFSSGDVSAAVVERLRQLSPDHLRVDIHVDESNALRALRDATGLCKELGTSLEVALHAETLKDETWNPIEQLLGEHSNRIARCLLFHAKQKTTPAGWFQAAIARLLNSGWDFPVGVGTDAYFAELNREPPLADGSQFVCFSLNPQVHAFDNLTLRENLEALPTMIDSAHRLTSSNVSISPVTLRPRFNPNATVALSRQEQLHSAIDHRQSTGFGAAWTVGVFASVLLHSRLGSMTMFEAWGPRGIITDDGNDLPMTAVFDSVFKSCTMFSTRTSQPLDVQVLAGGRADGERFLLAANLAEQPTTMRMSGGRQVWLLPPESIQFISQAESER